MKSSIDWTIKERVMQPPEDWWLDVINRMLVKGSVLDIGCSRGRFTEFLSKDHDYIGIDFNCKAIEAAIKLYPNQKFECVDITKWDRWHKFDNIFTWATLQHIPPPDIYDLFKKIKKYGKNLIFCEVTKAIKSDYQWTHPYEKYFKLIDKFPVMSGISHIMNFKGEK